MLTSAQETAKRTFLNSKLGGNGACQEWQGHLSNKGYGKIRGAFGGKMLFAHRVAYEAYWGSIPDGMQVRHGCDNRKCINPMHLYIGSNDDNIGDMVERKRSSRGLTCEQVLEIRRLHSEGASRRALAAMFGCHYSTITRIITRERRPYVPGEFQ